MLTQLSLQDFILVRSLSIEFYPGMSVLTGETGAGKSILLKAMSLLLGGRSSPSLIRPGASCAVLTGEFTLPLQGPWMSLCQDQGIPFEGMLLIRRLIGAPQRIYVNDHQVTLSFLEKIGETLAEIHSQFDRLGHTLSPLEILDAGLPPSLSCSVSETYTHWKAAEKAYQNARRQYEELRGQEDWLHEQIGFLDSLSLLPHEEDQLMAERESLGGLGQWAGGVGETYHLLKNSNTLEVLDQALRLLKRLPSDSPTTPPGISVAIHALSVASSETIEAYAHLEETSLALEQYPQHLQRIDERLHKLRAAARRHRTTPNQLSALLEEMKMQLSHLQGGESALEQLQHRAEETKRLFEKQSLCVREWRTRQGVSLDQSLNALLPDLMLPHARFETRLIPLSSDHWHQGGIDQIEFWVSMNQGQPFTLLHKTASGGEMARLTLALKSILAQQSVCPVLIFDEIDTGVSGSVAAAIGRHLYSLSHHTQVIAVTHSPQVAAAADRHYLVRKCSPSIKENLESTESPQMPPETTLILLSSEERQEELARMVAGREVTPEAKAAARRLLTPS